MQIMAIIGLVPPLDSDQAIHTITPGMLPSDVQWIPMGKIRMEPALSGLIQRLRMALLVRMVQGITITCVWCVIEHETGPDE